MVLLLAQTAHVPPLPPLTKHLGAQIVLLGLDDAFTKEAFLADLHDWESAVKPAYAEHKIALGYGVYGTPKHVIDGKLVPDTESAWGAAEWAEKLKSL